MVCPPSPGHSKWNDRRTVDTADPHNLATSTNSRLTWHTHGPHQEIWISVPFATFQYAEIGFNLLTPCLLSRNVVSTAGSDD